MFDVLKSGQMYLICARFRPSICSLIMKCFKKSQNYCFMLIKSEEFLFSVGWIRYSFVGKEPFAIIKETQPLI